MFLWELKNTIISTNLRELCVIKANTNIPHIVASTSSATKSFITRCLSLSKAHYFYCIKIRALYRTSLMFLWELKNAIISQNLRELCVIKINTNIPHIVASTSSATVLFITTHGALACRRPFLFLPVISTPLNHRIIYYYTRCLSVVEGTFSILISVPEPVEGTLFLLH